MPVVPEVAEAADGVEAVSLTPLTGAVLSERVSAVRLVAERALASTPENRFSEQLTAPLNALIDQVQLAFPTDPVIAAVGRVTSAFDPEDLMLLLALLGDVTGEH